jgi:glutamate racemase
LVKNKISVVTLSFVLATVFTLCSKPSGAQVNNDLSAIYGKDEITVVITDSGLGGLSVMNNIAGKLEGSGCYRKVNLIFVNALFDANTGYNSLQTREEKISVFNNVLTGIKEHFKPDIIFVACNTLSVIYKETDFVRRSTIPVIGIVEPGVQLIKEKLEKDINSTVIIFGTETTIEEGSHKKELLKLNFAEGRIITKACPQLQSYIEQNPSGEETEMLISAYVSEALEGLPRNNGALYLSLNCSHFGYSTYLWEKAFSSYPYKLGGIIDPNSIMGDILIDDKLRNRFNSTEISFRVVSRVEFLNKNPISGIFLKSSPKLAEAVQNYSIIPNLFK